MTRPQRPIRCLITAGPTQEPIDEVRFVGNRSSGRLGVAVARAAVRRGWETRLLLGPCVLEEAHTACAVERFRTSAELGRLMDEHAPWCDALVMAAAVADFRPAGGAAAGKRRRDGGGWTLRLEPTEDLLAAAAARKREQQCFAGFALAERARLDEAAKEKLTRKGVDLIVANPLETMDAETVCAAAWGRTQAGGAERVGRFEPEGSKEAFAAWLVELLAARLAPQPPA